MLGRTVHLVVGLAFVLSFPACGQTQDAPTTDGSQAAEADATPAATVDASPTIAPNPAGDNDSVTVDDPASLDVEFDVGELEGFDSEEFNLAAVDPEADAKLRSTVQNVLIASGVIVMGVIGLVIYFRSKRRNRT